MLTALKMNEGSFRLSEQIENSISDQAFTPRQVCHQVWMHVLHRVSDPVRYQIILRRVKDSIFMPLWGPV